MTRPCSKPRFGATRLPPRGDHNPLHYLRLALAVSPRAAVLSVRSATSMARAAVAGEEEKEEEKDGGTGRRASAACPPPRGCARSFCAQRSWQQPSPSR